MIAEECLLCGGSPWSGGWDALIAEDRRGRPPKPYLDSDSYPERALLTVVADHDPSRLAWAVPGWDRAAPDVWALCRL